MSRGCSFSIVRAIMFRFRHAVAFIRLGRPLFLLGGFAHYGLGAAAAAWASPASAPMAWGRFAWGQAAITAAQLMTHYCNDYYDLAADRANLTPTRWSGGSRVLPSGALPPGVALAAALALALVVLGVAARLAAAPGVGSLAAPILLAIVVLAWEYSAPPMRLCATGLGELDTALVVSLLTPLTGYYLQAGRLATLPFLAAAPLMCLQIAMLLAIELPDAAGDAATGKRTLVVRWGAARAARLYQGSIAAAYLALPVLVAAGLPARVALAVLGTSPLALALVVGMRRGAWREPLAWARLAFGSVALLFATAAVEMAAFVLAARAGR